jgi:hypothetical protein
VCKQGVRGEGREGGGEKGKRKGKGKRKIGGSKKCSLDERKRWREEEGRGEEEVE